MRRGLIDGYCTLGTQRETLLSGEMLLRSMDSLGIASAVVAPEDREVALFNAEGNARIAKAARGSGGRLIAACAVSPWQGEKGVGLLREAVSGGARVLVLAPALQGFMIGDDLTDPLLEGAAQMRLPVYVHTGPQACGAPSQLVLLALRHPQTRFILAHGGTTDHAWDMPVVLRQAPENIWFELSLVRPWAAGAYAGQISHDRMIFASGAPRNNPAMELEHLNKYLPIAEHPMIYGGALGRLIDEVLP